MIQRLLTLAAMLLLAACAKDAPPSVAEAAQAADTASLVLRFQAEAGLNPGPGGEPAPVRVRIFELKNPALFLRSDYFALAERAPATLGADLIDQDEVLIQPGDQLSLERTLDPATRHLGLLVGYREIDQAQWRTVVNVPSRQHSEYLISLDARAVRSAVAASPSSPAQ
jgi:type VI secretion system protein VasD